MTQVLPRPCSAAEAVARALQLAATKGGKYELGTGDYRPRVINGQLIDTPWTTNDAGELGSDCAGFASCWAPKIQRHRPGYNAGPGPRGPYPSASCVDDINCNSALEDAFGAQDLFTVVRDAPKPGDMIAYPTIYLPGHALPWSGHVCIVVGVDRAGAFDINKPDWSLLDVVQVCGPNGRAPAALKTDGSIWNQHDHDWPKPEHRSWLIRLVP